MKFSDIFEFVGAGSAQGYSAVGSNAKSSEKKGKEPAMFFKQDDKEQDQKDDQSQGMDFTDRKNQQQLARGAKRIGAMMGKKVAGMPFAKGVSKVQQQKIPGKPELKDLEKILPGIAQAMADPKLNRRMMAVFKQLDDENIDENLFLEFVEDKFTKSKYKRRKQKLHVQGKEPIFEINFNQKNLVKQAFDLPVKCGFEAETSWPDIGGESWDPDDYNWYDIEDRIHDYEGSSSVRTLENAYNEWLSEKAYDIEGDILENLVSEREEDETYLNDYVEAELSEDEIEEYKENFLDGMDEDQQEEYEDWDFIAWGRQYTEEERLEDFKDWLREMIRDNGEAYELAIDQAGEDYSMDDWASEEYGSWSGCLSEYSIYLGGDEEGGIEEVGDLLNGWAEDHSAKKSVRTGDYHANAGDTDQDYWRVEVDPSIETSGTKAEIISPVYNTPREMLKELKSLCSWLDEHNAETNSSTGLHITMSYDGTQGAGPGFKGHTNNLKSNDLKLAVLLGDKYLLSTFGRERNSYAKSTIEQIKNYAENIKKDLNDSDSLEKLENLLSKGINKDKYSAINYTDRKDKKTDNPLVEFRIGGGNDYHENFENIVKATVRYAVTMDAAYDNKKYKKDYIAALFRLVNNIGKISDSDIERAKGRTDIEHPAIDVLKDFFGKSNYVKCMHTLSAAFNNLNEYETLSEPSADRKWKKQVNDYEKASGEKLEIVEDESFTGVLKPDTVKPSKRAPAMLSDAQEKFAKVILQAGYDLNQNLNRKPVNAKGIGILRKTLRDFKLSYDKLEDLIIKNYDVTLEEPSRQGKQTNEKQKILRIKNGVDRLFKYDVIKEPEFLTSKQVENLTQGMWNAIQSGELQDGTQAIKFANMLADASGTDEDYAARFVDEIRSQSANREYKEFHAKINRGSYSGKALFKAGDPIDSKKLKTFVDHLKTYPEWNHPVAKGHNPNITGDDSYIDNALSKMMIKMRSRWEHLEDIRQDNPGLYIDSMREIALLVARLVDANKTKDHMMGDKHKDLLGTEHANHRDGAQYFGMGLRTAEQLMDMVKGIEQPNTRMVWDDPVTHQLRDSIQNYIRGAYSRYYDMKSREGDGFYRLGSVPEIIKQRTDAIKEFLTGFDKVAQKLGFDSQSSEIANKKQLDQKQANFKKKHGPTNLVKVDGYDFGGDIYIQKRVADNLSDAYTDRDLARLLTFNNKHVSQANTMLRIPSAHYFTALDAYEILKSYRFDNTWRKSIAEEILEKFREIYEIPFDSLDDKYININQGRIKTQLKSRGVEFTKDLGDGRIGMGDYGPLLDKKALEGPHGEPFAPSAATAWKVNNPELAKKVDADEKKRLNSIDIQIPKQAGVENMEGEASASIGDATNWSNLAKYLKIEAGVNDQGVELLKTVYDMFDSATSGEYAAEGYGMERFVDAVKKAKTYIEKNYQVSGGNYFKKNADGSTGDENTPAHLQGLNDFGKARVKFREFDYMMQNGINRFVKHNTDKANLVAFLNDESQSDKATKQKMLQLMIDNVIQNSREPMGVSQAFVRATSRQDNDIRSNDRVQRDRARMLSRESTKINTNNMNNIFENFDNLSIEQQLEIVRNSAVLEKWSQKYKDSINCSNPKGFSQKAHCNGKKKNEGRMKQWAMSKYGDDFMNEPLRPTIQYRPGNQVRTMRPKKKYNPDNHRENLINFLMHQRKINRDQAEKQVFAILQKNPDYFKRVQEKFNERMANEAHAVQFMNNIPRDDHGNTEFGKIQDFIKKHDRGNSLELMYKLEKEYGIDRREARELLRRYTWLGNKRHKTQYVERKLSNKETNKKEKYVKGMKKNKDDFEKRYGKDAKAVMYATATKMAKASESLVATDLLLRTKKLAENVPNNNKIEIINDILSKPFPVGDLDLQFKAYLALPIPKMMTDFSKLKSAMGPEACARDIVRHYVKFRFPKSELEKVNLNESVQQQCPKTKASICSCKAIESLTEAKQSVKALCDFEHGEAKGVVYFKQKAGEPTVLTGYIRNLTPGLHGLHIHEFGDLSDGCDSAGAHYNPDGVDHGGIEAGHVGDLGNIEADQSGEAKFKIVAERVTLADVVGRALVVHADEDDLGKGGNEESLKTGNAGERSGCGVIRLMNVDETTTFENSAGNLALKRKGIQPKYYRNEMPQLKINHIMNPKFRQKHNLEYRRGKIGLDKIRPTQIDRIPGLADSAKKFFAQGNVEPFILDLEGNLVNGHHRYDAATELGVKRVPVIVVNKHMDELVRLFPHTVSKTGKASDIKGFKSVAPVDVVDVSSDEYEKELARREINKARADQRSISRQQQQRDAGQLELPFNNKKDKEPA